MDTGYSDPAQTPSVQVRARVDEAMADFLDARLERLHDDAVLPAFTTTRDFILNGGKRLRPLLCYWGWRGAGGEDCAGIFRAAAALEVFHAFCLIHDDIMDGSGLRRGLPTLHRSLAEQHTRQCWRGDPRRFGVTTAILMGDLCLSWADELLHTCGLCLHPALRYYHEMRSEACYGQYLDLLEQARGTSSAARSMTVVRYKSAKYTVERPLQFGGALAGASPRLLKTYAAFGLAVGEAFQLRDDILGAFGDPAATGKSDLDDFRQGKPTVMIAHALQHADPAQRRLIDALHGDPRLDDDGAERLRQLLVDTGARTATEKMIDERGERALTLLAAAPLSEPVHRELSALVTAALHRTA